MRKVHYLFFAVLTIAGLGLSILLVPGKGELALIHFKDKEYEIARRSYEERLSSGNRSIDVIIPLSQLYLQFGDVDKAVQLMEQFVHANPNDLAALQRLGKFFQYAERPQDYLKILERIAALDPSENRLRELASTYNFTAQYEKQIAVLKLLVEKYPENPQTFIDLANLQASNGSIVEAEVTMRRFEVLHPAAMTAETTELHLNLLLDGGKPQQALENALSWLKRNPNYETVVQFTDLFSFKKQPAFALRIIEPYDKVVDTYPNLLRELIQLYVSNGKSDAAYERLKRLYADGKLPEIVAERLVDLALSRQETDFAIAVTEKYDLAALPNWLLADLAEAALSASRAEFLSRMVSQLGEGFLLQQPVLGAQLAVARNDALAALQWIEKAEKNPGLDTRQRISLGNLYITLNRPGDALRSYEQAAARPDAPDYLFLQLADLYIKNHKAEQGLTLIDGLRAKRRSLDVETAWALVASAVGQGDRVLAWFRTTPKNLSLQSLSDLYFAATEAAQPKLAVAVAERLYRQRGSRGDELHFATALLAVSQPGEALKYFRVLLADTVGISAVEHADEEEAYVEALNAALRSGEPVGEELKSFWSQRLIQSGLPETKREEVIYALLDLKDYSTVLPTMEQLARKDSQWLFAFVDTSLRAGMKPQLVQFLQNQLNRANLDLKTRETDLRLLVEHGGYFLALSFLRQIADEGVGDWVQVYEEALLSLNRKQDLEAFLRDRVTRSGLKDMERRSIANRLLELGDKRSAEDVFLKLASNAAPDSPDVSQLLYLWGPRPGTAALEWLEARGRSASGSARAAWMHHLINAGAPNRAVRFASEDEAAEQSVFDAYIDALTAVNDKAALERVLHSAALRESDPTALRRLGRIALENGMTEAGRLAFEKLLRARPEDRETLKRLGVMALWDGNFSGARQWLGRLTKLDGGDYETHFYVGEVLNHDHDRAAQAEYQRALELLQASNEQTIEAGIIRAQLLQRLGRTTESLAYFKTLMVERPNDRNVQNEYIAALLQAGHYEDTNQILSAK